MQTVGLFFKYSPKRQRTFEVSIDQVTNEDRLTKSKIKPLCETRWVERHTAFDDLSALYQPLLDCLDFIQRNENRRFDSKTVNEASGLNTQLRSSQFLVSFVICQYIFGFTKGLSRLLQGTSMDIVTAYKQVDHVTAELEKIRTENDSEFRKLFATANSMAEEAGVTIVKPRAIGRQTLRNNVPSENVEEYFRRSIFLPFVDCLIAQLKERFSGRASDAIQAMYLIPSLVFKMSTQYDRVIEAITSYYGDDLPQPGDIDQEIRLWKRKWSSTAEDDRPQTLSQTLKKVRNDGEEKIYPNIVTIMRILLAFSATSASVERTNSALRFVKNAYRSTMVEDRFNALMLLFVHRDIPLEYGAVIDKYARKYPRRMLFCNPLSTSD